MSTLKFKTNIMCENCVSTVKPYLDDWSAVEKWDVDLNSSDRILEVNGKEITGDEVKKVLDKAGFKAEELG